jgi:hypothetical protein
VLELMLGVALQEKLTWKTGDDSRELN